jgi:glutamate 5-kinase
VLLSDVEAFLMDGKPLDEVGEVTEAVEAAAGGASGLGSGGMITKVNAAKVVTAAGGYLLIAHGRRHSLSDLLDGKPGGTLFRPSGSRLDHRKRWIAHTLKESGVLTVDDGGVEALRRKGRSLLSVGVTGCDGDFEAGDAVLVRDRSGRAIAKGLVNYSSNDLRRIMGRRTEEIEGVLVCRPSDEIVHRDNMVILG